MNDLMERFMVLTETEKLEFIKLIMPDVRKLFIKDAEALIKTIAPFTKDILKESNLTLPQLVTMITLQNKN